MGVHGDYTMTHLKIDIVKSGVTDYDQETTMSGSYYFTGLTFTNASQDYGLNMTKATVGDIDNLTPLF